MTTTAALALNTLLMAVIVGGLAAVVRLALRLPDGERPETLHPSQPIAPGLAPRGTEEAELARAA